MHVRWFRTQDREHSTTVPFAQHGSITLSSTLWVETKQFCILTPHLPSPEDKLVKNNQSLRQNVQIRSHMLALASQSKQQVLWTSSSYMVYRLQRRRLHGHLQVHITKTNFNFVKNQMGWFTLQKCIRQQDSGDYHFWLKYGAIKKCTIKNSILKLILQNILTPHWS